uniref:Uncharacterized protein n=1 Tax=Podoviridae sp. ct8Lf7 TaxID=2827723 RepID=A0A8S5S0B3_9CAUD|nr:MAG TPA: hypothetical protein [Podoviridae sp. ct8Lf7]
MFLIPIILVFSNKHKIIPFHSFTSQTFFCYKDFVCLFFSVILP